MVFLVPVHPPTEGSGWLCIDRLRGTVCALVCLCGRVLEARRARARDTVLVFHVGSRIFHNRSWEERPEDDPDRVPVYDWIFVFVQYLLRCLFRFEYRRYRYLDYAA